MAQLQHHVIAREKKVKVVGEKALTAAYHGLTAGSTSGLIKTYEPAVSDGEQYPPEHNKIKVRVEDALTRLQEDVTAWFDTTLTKDEGNAKARADISIDGEIIAKDVPSTHLVWLEHRMTELVAFVESLPVLPEDKEWTSYDLSRSAWVTTPIKNAKQAVVKTPTQLAAATDKHAAQVVLVDTPTVVGYWTTQHMSGALPAERHRELVRRVRKLAHAVTAARQTANETPIQDHHIGAKLFGYLFKK